MDLEINEIHSPFAARYNFYDNYFLPVFFPSFLFFSSFFKPDERMKIHLLKIKRSKIKELKEVRQEKSFLNLISQGLNSSLSTKMISYYK